MSKQEFITQMQQNHRQLKRSVLRLGLSAGTCLMLGALADSAKDRGLLANVGFDVGKLFLGLCLAVTGIFVVQIILVTNRMIKCPHCGKPQDGIHGHIVIATGCCGFCGEQFFDQPTTVLEKG